MWLNSRKVVARFEVIILYIKKKLLKMPSFVPTLDRIYFAILIGDISIFSGKLSITSVVS